MPILQPDPWRQLFFEGHDCPDHIIIPTKDGDAYRLNPDYSWAYNKLIIAEKQGLRCGPHGIKPDFFPVFSKPIYNLRSMGAGSCVINSAEEYKANTTSGHMWAELLKGDHYSTDVAVIDGKVSWFRHTIGYPLEGGTFDYWKVTDKAEDDIESYLSDFILKHFSGYTGMMNFELIGGKIIEMHLRFADQWPDLYGSWFVPALIGLYTNKQWPSDTPKVQTGYSIVAFKEPRQYKHPSATFVQSLLDIDGISSVQFPFYEDQPFDSHSTPPGGFRILTINTFDLENGKIAREKAIEEIERIS